jgi:hypothetical protein
MSYRGVQNWGVFEHYHTCRGKQTKTYNASAGFTFILN